MLRGVLTWLFTQKLENRLDPISLHVFRVTHQVRQVTPRDKHKKVLQEESKLFYFP